QNQGNAFSTTSADYYLENDGLLGGYNATFGNSVLFGNALTHAGDTDTQILFTSDQVAFNIGGSTALTLNEAGSDIATFGSGWEVRMGSLFANASSTIGGGTGTTGLTVSGNSTTTGNAYFAGRVGIGEPSPYDDLFISNNQDDYTSIGI